MKLHLQQLLVILLVTVGCHEYVDVGPIGPRGPVGPVGPQGPAGESGYLFEYTDIFFVGPHYEVFLPFPEDFETFPTDVALVYFLWGTEEINGELVDIWRPLPQEILFSDGILQYNFDFTYYDVRLFLDATFPLDELTAIDTDDWIARVVIVPAEFWESGRVDINNYYDVVGSLNLDKRGVHTAAPTRR